MFTVDGWCANKDNILVVFGIKFSYSEDDQIEWKGGGVGYSFLIFFFCFSLFWVKKIEKTKKKVK